MNPRNPFRHRRPAPLPVQALAAIAQPGPIPDREQIVQDPSAPYDDVEMEAFAPGSLADQAEAFLANRAGGAA